MSHIFISYKREEQATAQKLAEALQGEGWTVWWDPKIRAGEYVDDVIEKALNEAKCVLVMWSSRSVNSEYVRAEATQALEQKKLIPVMIENVTLPFRFKRIHTGSLIGWNGSRDAIEFRKLVDDVSTILGPSATEVAARSQQNAGKTEERTKPSAPPPPPVTPIGRAVAFRLAIEDVFQISGRGTVVTGVVTSGTCRIGQEVVILKGNVRVSQSVVMGIELFKKMVDRAETGDNVGLVLRDQFEVELERGMVVVGRVIETPWTPKQRSGKRSPNT